MKEERDSDPIMINLHKSRKEMPIADLKMFKIQQGIHDRTLRTAAEGGTLEGRCGRRQLDCRDPKSMYKVSGL